MKALILSDANAVTRMKALITDAFSEDAFLRSGEPHVLAQKLGKKLVTLLLAGEDEGEIVDGLIALGHGFDFNDQWGGSGWHGQVFVSRHLDLKFRIDEGAERNGPPSGVDLEVTFRP